MLISEIFKNKLCPTCNKCIVLKLQNKDYGNDCACISNYYAMNSNVLFFLGTNFDYKIINDNSFSLYYEEFNIKIPDQDINNIPNIINKLKENIAFN